MKHKLTQEETDRLIGKIINSAEGRSNIAKAGADLIRHAVSRRSWAVERLKPCCPKCGTELYTENQGHSDEECTAASVLLT